VIEAREMSGKRFVVSVQWHPEWRPDSAPMRQIFKAFVDASGQGLGA
jgi:gamma-glutamyl-gamma-aminobutyrate hydrolase PuuD